MRASNIRRHSRSPSTANTELITMYKLANRVPIYYNYCVEIYMGLLLWVAYVVVVVNYCLLINYQGSAYCLWEAMYVGLDVHGGRRMFQCPIRM